MSFLLSTGGEQVYLQGGLHLGGLHLGKSASRGSASRGVCIQGFGQTLTSRALQGMVNKWAVRILLEYILEYPCSPPVDRRNDIRLWNTHERKVDAILWTADVIFRTKYSKAVLGEGVSA